MLGKIFDGIKFLQTTLIYLVYPPMCPICRKIVEERGEICSACEEKIFRMTFEKVPSDFLDGIFCLTEYYGGTRPLLHKLKFENDTTVLPMIKKILEKISARNDLKNFLAQADCAVYVPLHKDRFKQRGYNQTELIFENFFEQNNLPTENFLMRTRHTPRLYKLDPSERKKVLEDAFVAAENLDLSEKKILLVDDIFTTGATLTECAKVLKNCGAKKIFALTFASANKNPTETDHLKNFQP